MVAERAFTAACALVERHGHTQVVSRPIIEISGLGEIEAIRDGGEASDSDGPLVVDLGRTLVLPGFVDAHSHAFQRSIRGRTGRRSDADPSSFWSWRDAMYGVADALDPEGVYRATRDCFTEMIRAGITCVGEFHYLHHRPGGAPYGDPNELSLRVVQAAHDVGIRLCLLEVFYARAGAGRPPQPEQRRFCDSSLDDFLLRIEALRALPGARLGARHPEGFSVGIAPHSVRAVGAEQLRGLASYASAHDLVLHAHVSEQRRENAECLTEHGKTPVQLLADTGCLARPGAFTAVHAIHVDAEDARLLAGQHVCACPSTEADLGDGIVPATEHRRAGARLALGSDSNGIVDLVQEARLLEMHERLRTGERLCLADEDGRVATMLLRAATEGGASSLGLASTGAGRPGLGRLAVGAPFDAVAIDLEHPTLAGVPEAHVLDALMLTGTAAPVRAVWVAGRRRV